MKTSTQQLTQGKITARKKINIKETLPLLCMVIPFFIIVVIFSYVPLWGWLIAFFDYFPGTSIFSQQFVGLKYFKRIIDDPQFFTALRNTLCLSGLALLTYPFAPVLAILLNEVKSKPFKKIVQTVTSFPNFISWIITYSIFFTFLSVDDGVINQILLSMGLIKEPTNILANPDIAWFFQTMFAAVWKNVGWVSITYLAAISGIDQELYNVAELDGAGRFRKIWHITVPGILPTFTVMLVLGAAGILSAGFDQYYVFTNPLVFSKLDNIDTYVFRMGLEGLDYPFATAVGLSRSIVSVLLLFTINNFSKFVRGYKII